MALVSKGTRNAEMARKTKNAPHLRLRVEPGLLARLEKSAAKNERTLTGEIVHRLQHSYEPERQIEDVFGGRDVYGLMRVIAAAIYETGQGAGYYTTGS